MIPDLNLSIQTSLNLEPLNLKPKYGHKCCGSSPPLNYTLIFNIVFWKDYWCIMQRMCSIERKFVLNGIM